MTQRESTSPYSARTAEREKRIAVESRKVMESGIKMLVLLLVSAACQFMGGAGATAVEFATLGVAMFCAMRVAKTEGRWEALHEEQRRDLDEWSLSMDVDEALLDSSGGRAGP